MPLGVLDGIGVVGALDFHEKWDPDSCQHSDVPVGRNHVVKGWAEPTPVTVITSVLLMPYAHVSYGSTQFTALCENKGGM